MARTEVRSKAKPKRSGKGVEELKRGMRILVEDLRVGDRIALTWHRADVVKPLDDDLVEFLRYQVLKGDMSPSQAQLELFDEIMKLHEERYVNRSKKVERIDICESGWRTHIHVNKQDCYDTRHYVWIVDEKS